MSSEQLPASGDAQSLKLPLIGLQEVQLFPAGLRRGAIAAAAAVWLSAMPLPAGADVPVRSHHYFSATHILCMKTYGLVDSKLCSCCTPLSMLACCSHSTPRVGMVLL